MKSYGIHRQEIRYWGMQSDMGEITLMLAKHKTTDNFEKTGAFTVAFGTADTILISDYFGVETGNKVNKIEKAGCHVHRSAHVNAPIIEEYPLTLECKVRNWDPETGYLIGEIVASQVDDRWKSGSGKTETDHLRSFLQRIPRGRGSSRKCLPGRTEAEITKNSDGQGSESSCP